LDENLVKRKKDKNASSNATLAKVIPKAFKDGRAVEEITPKSEYAISNSEVAAQWVIYMS
jgi:hypothetical protein